MNLCPAGGSKRPHHRPWVSSGLSGAKDEGVGCGGSGTEAAALLHANLSACFQSVLGHWMPTLRRSFHRNFLGRRKVHACTCSRSAPTAAKLFPATTASWSAPSADTTSVVRITTEAARAVCNRGALSGSSPLTSSQAPENWASVREAWREAEPCAPGRSAPSQADRAAAPRCGDRTEP